MQQRYYDPVIGRLLSRDEVTAYEKPLTNFNAYVYALNNPYRFTDPDGRESACFSNNSGCGLRPETAQDRRDVVVSMVGFAGVLLGAITGGTGVAAIAAEIHQYGVVGATLGNAPAIQSAAAGVAEAAGVTGTATAGAKVTAERAAAALEGSTMQTTQQAVSLPAVQRYADALASGSKAPAIKVEGNVIVDGAHRYVAGRIVGQEPAVTPGTLAPSQAGQVQPIQNLKFDPTDWGNN